MKGGYDAFDSSDMLLLKGERYGGAGKDVILDQMHAWLKECAVDLLWSVQVDRMAELFYPNVLEPSYYVHVSCSSMLVFKSRSLVGVGKRIVVSDEQLFAVSKKSALRVRAGFWKP